MARRASKTKRRTSGRRPPREPARRKTTFVGETILITSLAAGGDGVGRLEDGRVVFVRASAVGDRVHVGEAEEAGSFLRADAFELVEPGESRREPGCRVFGRCGGCSWQHIEAAAQREARKQILHDAVSRIAKLQTIPEIGFVESPAEYGYRGRIRVLVRAGATGFRRARSHAIEPIDHCPVLQPELDEGLRKLAHQTRADPGAREAEFEYELAVAKDGSVRTTCLDESEARKGGGEPIELSVSGESIRVSPGGFSQANPLLFDAMIEGVGRALSGVEGGRLLELYAGSGFFTVGLARRFEHVVAIESSRAACRDLEANLRAAGRAHVEVRCARVEHHLDALAIERPDVLLLDPPRSGLPRGVADGLARLGAPRIAYLSCDPATLARDLAPLCRDSGGYRLSGLTVFDVFPQTPHVETLAVLDL